MTNNNTKVKNNYEWSKEKFSNFVGLLNLLIQEDRKIHTDLYKRSSYPEDNTKVDNLKIKVEKNKK